VLLAPASFTGTARSSTRRDDLNPAGLPFHERNARRLCLEVILARDELRVMHEDELHVFAAFIAGQKPPSSNARDLLSLGVFSLVNHGIDSGLLDLVASFELTRHSSTAFSGF
jgi:hypothetical protein